MFRKKVKKAFTLVELLVVIAILAILATVSVVGDTQFTKRAQQSNDMSLTTQINTVLQADEVTGKPQTMTEAIAVMEEAGANIAELTPTTEGYSYVWNSATNRVILLDGGKKVVAPADATIDNPADCYAIIKSEADLTTWAGYSLYFTREYAGTGYTLPATSSLVSVDVGTSAIKTLNILAGNGTATIYTTEGSTVTINAPGATINHYGEAASVDVREVAENSYHLYGTVTEDIQITKGRVVIANGASAEAVVLNGNNIKVDVENNATLNAIAATDSEYMETSTLPDESIVPAFVGDTTAALYFNGGFGTAAAPYEIDNAEQLINLRVLAVMGTTSTGNSVYMFNKPYYVELTNDIYFEDVQASGYILNIFIGEFNGNGHSIYAGNDSITLFEDANGTTTIKNVTVVQSNAENWFQLVECAGFYNIGGIERVSLTLDNIIMKAENEETVFEVSNNVSGFLYYTWMDTTFKNCTNYLNIQIGGGGYSGVFLGGYATKPNNGVLANSLDITFDTCVNEGKIVGKNVGFFTGNTCDGGFNIVDNADFSDRVSDKHNAYITNCVNNGTLIGTVDCQPFANNSNVNAAINEELMAAAQQDTASYKNNGTMDVISVDGLGLNLGENNTISITCNEIAGIAYFEVTYYVQMSFDYEDGSQAGSSYVIVTVQVSPETIANGQPYVYAIVGSNEYEESTGTPYASINAKENADDRGNKYKLVQTKNGLLCVVSSESMIEAVGWGAASVTLNQTKTTYRVTAFDEEGYSLGSVTYSSGSIEK